MGLHSSIYPALFILTVLSIILSCHEPADKGISKLELAPEVNTEKVKPLSVDMSIQNNLIKTVNVLSEEIGSRDYLQSNALDRAVDYISSELRGYGHRLISALRGSGENVQKYLC